MLLIMITVGISRMFGLHVYIGRSRRGRRVGMWRCWSDSGEKIIRCQWEC